MHEFHYPPKPYKNCPPLVRTAYLAEDADLFDHIQTLIQNGADADGKSPRGQSAIRILFNRCCMDGFRLLHKHGASLEEFRWSPLRRAIAVGSLQEIATLATDENLKKQDCSGRSPYILACRLGEVEKAAFLHPLTSETAITYSVRDQTALHVAARGVHVPMMKWLIAHGAEVNNTGNFGGTALLTAVQYSKIGAVKLLLEEGADVRLAKNLSESLRSRKAQEHAKNAKADSANSALTSEPEEDYLLTPVGETNNPEVMQLLIDAGVPFEEFSSHVILKLAGAAKIPPVKLTPAQFDQYRDRKFGTTNPQLSANPFYREQIRTGYWGGQAGKYITGTKISEDRDRPIWSFGRYGRTKTGLPDSRFILIAGEHEDSYHPDFCIYNDVTVLDGKGGVEHYLYPRDVFPPTDSHSATLLGDSILLIGNLNYREGRQEGVTQVTRLSLDDYSIARVETSGENPGWISRHTATLNGREIVVSGGIVEPGYRDQNDTYSLNIDNLIWKRLT